MDPQFQALREPETGAIHEAAHEPRLALKVMGISKAAELAETMAAIGLAQNLGALRALVKEGIQQGHMRLHARNLVVMAGAEGDLIGRAVKALVESGEIRFDKAQEIVKRLEG